MLLAKLLSEPLAEFIVVKSYLAANKAEESAYDKRCYMYVIMFFKGNFSLVEYHGDGQKGNLKGTNNTEKRSARINAVTK